MKNFTCISVQVRQKIQYRFFCCLLTPIIDKCMDVCLSADDLSFKAITFQSTTQDGPQNLYDASNAVDRNTTTCTRTNQIGLNSPNKVDWWKVDLGETSKIYSINLLFKNYKNYGKYRFDYINSESCCSYRSSIKSNLKIFTYMIQHLLLPCQGVFCKGKAILYFYPCYF